MANARALKYGQADNVSSSGYDCEFVEEPPNRSQCPICLLVPRDPYQTLCCGNAFCKDCITKIKLHKKPCPTCKTEDFVFYPDKGLERELYNSQVCCSFKSRGCDWRGELRQLDQHLNSNFSQDNLLAGCAFLRICCDYCQHAMYRRQLQIHRNRMCFKRPFTCPTCKMYESDYDDVKSIHMPECKCRPVECPNKCGLVVEAQNLQAHLSSDCELTEVACEFNHAGCEVKIIRKLLPGHMTDNVVQHMSLLARENRIYKEKVISLEKEKKELYASVADLIACVADLESKQQNLIARSSQIPTIHIRCLCIPYVDTIKNPWLSQPFYTSLMGPSLQLCVWWNDNNRLCFNFVNRGPPHCCLQISTSIKHIENSKLLFNKIIPYDREEKSETTITDFKPEGNFPALFCIDQVKEIHTTY